MREEFEKLPGIARIIKESSAFYCKEEECYVCPDDDQFAESYLAGALYAYQEQQKKIDNISKYLVDSCGFDESQVKELLK